MQKKQILIVGAGFGGVKAALKLSEHEEFAVTLLSDRADFRYYPTLYHTATGGLKAQSSIPLSAIFAHKPVTMVEGKAVQLDRGQRMVITEDGQRFSYDTLILGLGTVTNYFGIQGLADYSYGIKSVEDALALKAHLHQQLTDDHKPDLNYVVIGAGPTGIELAGALPGYLRQIMANHGIKHRAVHVDIVEALPRLLPRSPKAVSRAVHRRLRKLGINLYLDQAVQGATAESLTINGKSLASHTTVWTAGVANHPFFKANNFQLSKRGKVIVNEFLQAENNIYVLGDNAETLYSGMAQTALYDGIYIANTIKNLQHSKKVKGYRAKQPITVIPVGPYWACVQWGKFTFSGKLGWLLRQAADWIGFHDLQPLWQASEQWMTEFGTQEECPTCATAQAE